MSIYTKASIGISIGVSAASMFQNIATTLTVASIGAVPAALTSTSANAAEINAYKQFACSPAPHNTPVVFKLAGGTWGVLPLAGDEARKGVACDGSNHADVTKARTRAVITKTKGQATCIVEDIWERGITYDKASEGAQAAGLRLCTPEDRSGNLDKVLQQIQAHWPKSTRGIRWQVGSPSGAN